MSVRPASYLVLVFAFMTLLSPGAPAVQPDEVLPNASLETRARALSRELRCMVCQNQSIDDSDAPLARDLRILVRERLTAGDSDRQVLDYLTARYGAFVLLKPPVTPRTVVLWMTPVAVLIVGVLALVLAARRRAANRKVPHSEPEIARLSPTEEARLAELMTDARDRGTA